MTQIIPEDEDVTTHEETIVCLNQEPMDAPTDSFLVRVKIGDMPLSIVGWVADAGALPTLFRDLANRVEQANSEWNAVATLD